MNWNHNPLDAYMTRSQKELHITQTLNASGTYSDALLEACKLWCIFGSILDKEFIGYMMSALLKVKNPIVPTTEEKEKLTNVIVGDVMKELHLGLNPEELYQVLQKIKTDRYSECTIDNGLFRTYLIEDIREIVPGKVATQVKVDVKLIQHDESFYYSINTFRDVVVAREYGLHPESKEPLKGTWVLRVYNTGEFLDSDRNRNDLFERNNLKV